MSRRLLWWRRPSRHLSSTRMSSTRMSSTSPSLRRGLTRSWCASRPLQRCPWRRGSCSPAWPAIASSPRTPPPRPSRLWPPSPCPPSPCLSCSCLSCSRSLSRRRRSCHGPRWPWRRSTSRRLARPRPHPRRPAVPHPSPGRWRQWIASRWNRRIPPRRPTWWWWGWRGLIPRCLPSRTNLSRPRRSDSRQPARQCRVTRALRRSPRSRCGWRRSRRRPASPTCRPGLVPPVGVAPRATRTWG